MGECARCFAIEKCESRPAIDWRAELARDRAEQRERAIEAAARAIVAADRGWFEGAAALRARSRAKQLADGGSPGEGQSDYVALAALRALGVRE